MSIEKITSEDGLSQSKNLIQENIKQLKKLFPEIVTEDKIDFKSLQQILGEEIEDEEEYYRFTWVGKSQARREAHKPSTGTLRPCKEESLDWDTTQNLYIEGDNLEVLKLLQKSYSGKIKIIYIDPPYNTGKDFVYKDNYKDNLKNYKEVTGQIDSEGNKLSTNSDSDGRYHSNWLNMMYPRLKLARNLLSDDGVIFMSIDDNEIDNLKKIGYEIFGEINLVSTITRVTKTTSFRGNHISPSKDYLIVIAKDIELLKPFSDEVDENQFKKIEKQGERIGEKYRDDIAFYLSTLETRPNQRYFIQCPDGTKVLPPGKTFPPDIPKKGDGVWRWNYESFMDKKDLIVFKKSDRSPLIDENGKQAKWNLYTKSYLSDKLENGNIPRDFWTGFLNREGTKDLKELNIPFDFPKPVRLIENIIKITGINKGYVLDFFSGSSTTAHAIFKLNCEQDKSLNFIQIQIPELIDKETDAFKKGFISICDIGKERIRKISKKFKTTNPILTNGQDLGFKVLKLDNSNIKSWDGNPENLESSLFDSVSNIKSDRTEEDVLYEILLKYGLDLTLPVEERNIQGKKVFNVGMGSLFICLGDDITSKVAEGIGEWKEECDPEVCRVIFKDNGFTDVEKTNSVQILKRFGINEIRSI